VHTISICCPYLPFMPKLLPVRSGRTECERTANGLRRMPGHRLISAPRRSSGYRVSAVPESLLLLLEDHDGLLTLTYVLKPQPILY
jgi:hypothetical protein